MNTDLNLSEFEIFYLQEKYQEIEKLYFNHLKLLEEIEQTKNKIAFAIRLAEIKTNLYSDIKN